MSEFRAVVTVAALAAGVVAVMFLIVGLMLNMKHDRFMECVNAEVPVKVCEERG